MVQSTAQMSLREWLQRPGWVLIIVSALSIGVVVVDGTLFRIWSLNRDRDRLEQRIGLLGISVREKEARLLEANRPEFIEKQARESLDFVREGDLVFVFSEKAQR